MNTKKLLLASAVMATSLASIPYGQAMQEENDEDLQLALRLSLQEANNHQNNDNEDWQELIRKIEENTRRKELEEEEELKRVLELSRLEAENSSKKIERELTSEEKFSCLGLSVLEDQYAKLYVEQLQGNFYDLEGRKNLHVMGYYLKDEFTEEGFQKIRKELGKDEPKKRVGNQVIPIMKEEAINNQHMESKEDIKRREFVKSTNEKINQIFPCILGQINIDGKQKYKDLETAMFLYKESSMSVAFTFEKNPELFEEVKEIFKKIHGPLTVDFQKASEKMWGVQSEVQKTTDLGLQTWHKLNEWQQDTNKTWRNLRPLLGEAICMFVQAAKDDDEPLRLLVEDHGNACVTGLNGRILLHLTNLLKTQVEAVEAGKRNLKN